MPQYTTAIGLSKPSSGTEPFTRSLMNANSDLIDKNLILAAFAGALYGTFSKGAMYINGGVPVSQSLAGPNGLVGKCVWTFTVSQITEAYQFTAPSAFTLTRTINLTNLAETWGAS